MTPAVAPLAADTAAVAALGVASLVVGYALLAGLWYFVFSPGAEARAERRRGQRGAAPEAGPAPPTKPPPEAADARPARLRRPPRRGG